MRCNSIREKKMGDVRSNLEGYSGCKEDSGKNEGEGSREKKEGSGNDDYEEFQGEENEVVQGEETHGTEEENEAEDLSKMKNLGDGEAKESDNPNDNEVADPVLGIKLSFLDTANIKADSSLRGDSWLYNELISLKSKVGKMQKAQEVDHAKIGLLESQVGNLPGKLNDYEQGLRQIIKESGKNVEQVTSSLCAAAASLGKKPNDEIMSPEGPCKRNRLSSRKRAAEAAAGSSATPLDTILSTVEVGKETARLIKELQ